jgi:hypothetical protein
MEGFSNIPEKFLRQLAALSKVKHRGRQHHEIINDISDQGHAEKLVYLDNQFRFTGLRGSNLTLCKPVSNFPDKSSDAEKFVNTLINEKYISSAQLGGEWRPSLSSDIKLCSVFRDGTDVYIKLVEGKQTRQKRDYDYEPAMYAHHTSVVIHFNDKVIELRCAYADRKKYSDYIMKIMGFGEPYEWAPLTIVTKDEAKEICQMLKAGVSSRHIALPLSVGSLRFNAKEGVDLNSDAALKKMIKAINEAGIPTNDTMDETCYFKFVDSHTGIEIEVSFEVNLKNGGFKFTKPVTETIYENVLEAFIFVCFIQKQNGKAQTATGLEETTDVVPE